MSILVHDPSYQNFTATKSETQYDSDDNDSIPGGQAEYYEMIKRKSKKFLDSGDWHKGGRDVSVSVINVFSQMYNEVYLVITGENQQLRPSSDPQDHSFPVLQQ